MYYIYERSTFTIIDSGSYDLLEAHRELDQNPSDIQIIAVEHLNLREEYPIGSPLAQLQNSAAIFEAIAEESQI